MTGLVVQSSTELLEKRAVRAGLAVLLLILGGLGVVDLGSRLEGPGPQLNECLREALDCSGQRFLLGGEVVSREATTITVRILSQDLVILKSWPDGVPSPALGDEISVIGTYLTDGHLNVKEAALYPLGDVDKWLGFSAVMAWAVVLIVFTRKRWLVRQHDG